MSKTCSRERERKGGGRERVIIRSYAIEKVPRGEKGNQIAVLRLFIQISQIWEILKNLISSKTGISSFCSVALSLSLPLSLFVIFIWSSPTPVDEKKCVYQNKMAHALGGRHSGGDYSKLFPSTSSS